MQHDSNQNPPKQSNDGPDDDMIAFASEVFDVARRGDAAMLDALLNKGLPPNLRNDKGDSLVMLASYHGHADAVRVLLEHEADPNLRNDNGQTPIAGAARTGMPSQSIGSRRGSRRGPIRTCATTTARRRSPVPRSRASRT